VRVGPFVIPPFLGAQCVLFIEVGRADQFRRQPISALCQDKHPCDLLVSLESLLIIRALIYM
jgi:hypothetical protein